MFRQIRLRIIPAVIAAAVLALPPQAAFAARPDSDTQIEILQASKNFQSVLQMIEESYYPAAGENYSVEDLYVSALRGMMDSLDPWTQYFTPDELHNFQAGLMVTNDIIGIAVDTESGQCVVSDVMDDSPAKLAGIHVGDVITQVAGVKITPENADHVAGVIADQNGPFKLTVMRGKTQVSFTLERSSVTSPSVVVRKITDVDPNAKAADTANIRYVQIKSFSDTTGREFGDALAAMKRQGVTGIVLDLRGNLGGYVDQAVDICQDIVPAGPIYYYLNKDGTDIGAASELAARPFAKIAVLTDDNTASAAELMAAALKDSGAGTVIGETTYGKGVMQTVERLPTGDAYKYTFQEYLGRNKEKINNVGVKPNIAIPHPGFLFKPVLLSNDMTSDDMPQVKAILAYLNYKAGPSMGADARKYDAAAQSAVKQFQSDHKLNPTGYFDVETLSKLDESLFTALSADNSDMDAALRVLLNNK